LRHAPRAAPRHYAPPMLSFADIFVLYFRLRFASFRAHATLIFDTFISRCPFAASAFTRFRCRRHYIDIIDDIIDYARYYFRY
jgi:hypothetical protein